MKIKKFIKSVTNYLGLGDYKIEGKKRSLKDLIKKLNERKSDIKKKLKESSAKKEKKELEEEFEIVSLEIKKGKEILYKLYPKKK
jgi:50S ribosomal subunit-associated GTPase HflX